jgi:hypothetical protein
MYLTIPITLMQPMPQVVDLVKGGTVTNYPPNYYGNWNVGSLSIRRFLGQPRLTFYWSFLFPIYLEKSSLKIHLWGSP